MISLNLISLNLTGHIFDTTRNKIYQKLVSYFQPLGAVSMVMTSTSCARRGEKPHRRWPENSTRCVAQTTQKSILPVAQTAWNVARGTFWSESILGESDYRWWQECISLAPSCQRARHHWSMGVQLFALSSAQEQKKDKMGEWFHLYAHMCEQTLN